MKICRIALLLPFFVFLASCGRNDTQSFQGWIEANLIFVGPDENGRIEKMEVREGDVLAKGALIFFLEADLQKADEIAASAALENARLAFARAEQLAKTNAGTQKAFDDAQAALREAQAKFNSAQTRLARRSVVSPVEGVVQQVYFRAGELVVAGRPIVAILPPGNVKVRFYVAQALLPRIAIGDLVDVHCDGCGPQKAKISFIAKQAEYTPPVIYSEQERNKLVFLVEALPEKPADLRVGQPVNVTVMPREQK
ncbi:MAG: efflux RND transporter periplasmic adaptor subunit [Xanthobacteraceae bacterium]|nr:efflux RND transporter periplasmic adaptor subunit [Xanthobacteraceae bacterium]MCW5675841.1 efflux RND transporter periplasmic adaptor subunit [Xanthobacteraceae bacterium]